MSSFSVTAAGQNVTLDSAGAAKASFTVTNTSPQALRVRLLTRPRDPAKPEWFTVVGESVRDFAPNGTQQVVVELQVPPGTPPGSNSFRLDAVSEDDPDEDFTEGPSVAFEVAAPPPPSKKKFPWWIFAIVGAVVLLIIIGVVVWLVTRGDNGSQGTVVSSGAGLIEKTAKWDADTGTGVPPDAPAADLWWRGTFAGDELAPQNTATLVNLGARNFRSITRETLSGLPYTTLPIPDNELFGGDVFAVHTTDGNFAKVLVVSSGPEIGVRWVTFRVGG